MTTVRDTWIDEPGDGSTTDVSTGDASPSEQPQRVGDYLVGPRLGHGTSASVYEGRHEPSGQAVAIKIMRERWKSSSGIRARFEREARTASIVRHPGIVRLLDAGVEPDGTRWQVMELLRGRDLASVLEERPLELGETFALARQLLDALDAVHQRGYVHRDLKPENVFVLDREDGTFEVKLIDFGIAKPMVPTTSMPAITAEGVLIGTPQYMCPEQITGDIPVTPASDLWALGAVLFTCLAGQPPFDDAQLSRLLVRIARQPAPSLLRFRADVPSELADVIARALHTHPARRYRDATAMRQALDAVLPHLPDLTSWF